MCGGGGGGGDDDDDDVCAASDWDFDVLVFVLDVDVSGRRDLEHPLYKNARRKRPSISDMQEVLLLEHAILEYSSTRQRTRRWRRAMRACV